MHGSAGRTEAGSIGGGPGSGPGGGLVVVSNRLPVQLRRRPGGGWETRCSSGGLVTALVPVLRRRGGAWVGWSGAVGEDPVPDPDVCASLAADFDLRPIALDREEWEGYYLRAANAAIWPALHGFPPHRKPTARDRELYRRVNRHFARHVPLENSRDMIWVHDYHLMLLGQELRRRGARQRLGFFLHTPFPDPDDFFRLPHAPALVRALLYFDALGFQTRKDLKNFRSAVDRLPQDAHPVGLHRSRGRVLPRVGHFPISIDVDEWARSAMAAPVTRRLGEIREAVGEDGLLVLGVDRLDHSKGLLEKLRAFRLALRNDPEIRRRATLLQLVVPSREDVPAYRELRERVESLVEEIREEFRDLDREPVRYVYGEWDRDELVAHYRAADVLLVNSLRDGMNLVSKEYCAARVDEAGVLILSRNAGSREELGNGALVVDPLDADEIARALSRSARMDPAERRRRMGGMRRWILHHDVHGWAERVLGSLGGAGPTLPVPQRRRVGPPLPARRTRVSPAVPSEGRFPLAPRSLLFQHLETAHHLQ